jgi:hypothetical protein
VEVIIFGGLQYTRYLEMDNFGLVYSLMCVQRLELVTNVINSQEKKNSIFASETHSGIWPFSAMGVRLYWISQSILKCPTLLDSNY